jgi:ParB-like chromosome segregation protein Spo0J
VDLAPIVLDLRPLAVPIAELVPDPVNARTHDERNLEAIRGSLAAYGQRKPVVVNRRTGIVLAGNGTLRAALSLNWTHLAAVYVDDDPVTATGFAIADNRTAELAGWDEAVLQKLLAEVEGPNAELSRMLDDLAASFQAESESVPEPRAESGREEEPATIFHVLVTGRNGEALTEALQLEVLEALTTQGFQVRALTA